MRIGEVIGTVTLSRWHPSLTAAAWRICIPLSRTGLKGSPAGREESFVTYDELGAGLGSLVAISEGAEASAAFHPEQKPIDAYNAAILDVIEVD
ncbi:MAG TPA: EutN/CcmL family microcompartment protein [Planctomycetaceae bacterium]|jgi:ethanolamine utilization protein EutN|nr:EutN/CcmL family microcompartment protein [Planctomycetaceae bacterium]